MATQVEDLVLLRVDEECAKLQADVSCRSPAPPPPPPAFTIISTAATFRRDCLRRRCWCGPVTRAAAAHSQGRYLEALDYMERSLVLRRCLYGNDRCVQLPSAPRRSGLASQPGCLCVQRGGDQVLQAGCRHLQRAGNGLFNAG